MMNVKKILTVAFAGAVVVLTPGCFSDYPLDYTNSAGSNGSERPAVLGKNIDVQYGSDARYENLEISFMEVLEDSRCPVDVECLWAGNARILLNVRVLPNGSSARVELNTHESFPRSVELGGYEITLANLKPDPISTVTIDPREYVATLQFVKK